ncbi:MAG TPA: hypothetical protein PKE68_16095 [Saprospiraceae bacterium]|nr:hypothetical protein [Saprospiraceae bacterium]
MHEGNDAVVGIRDYKAIERIIARTREDDNIRDPVFWAYENRTSAFAGGYGTTVGCDAAYWNKVLRESPANGG